MYSERSEKLFVPVQRNAFESPDRDLIQQYDAETLSPGDKAAFEKMGLITSRDLAPGPLVVVSTGASGSVGTGISVQFSRTIEKEYTMINGKKETIDYKKLQKPKYAGLDLDWGKARRSYLSYTLDQPLGFTTLTDTSLQPATFTVLFE